MSPLLIRFLAIIINVVGIYCEICVSINCNQCTGTDICRNCAPGYFLKQERDGTVLCNQCTNSNEYLDIKNNNYDGTGVCLSSDTCSQKQTGCVICANKYSECVECQTGFYLTPEGNNKCTDCQDQNYFKDGNSCKKCNPGQFIKYSANSTAKCTACEEAGYFKNGSLCSECQSKCDKCLSQNTCLACQKGYYLLNLDDATNEKGINNRTCLICPSNCEKCMDSTSCQKCFENFYLKRNFSQAGQSESFFCSTCDNKGKEYPDPKNNSISGSGSCLPVDNESTPLTGIIAGVTSGAAVLLLLIIYGVRRKRTKKNKRYSESNTKPNKSNTESNPLPVDIEQTNTRLNTRPFRPGAPFIGNRSAISNDVQTRKPRQLDAPKLENNETQNFKEIFKQFSSITFPNQTRLEKALENKKLIGFGSFGAVYKFKMSGAAYAIKIIQTEDEKSIAAAVNEINIFTKASCKQVIQMYGISTKENSNSFFDIYIIMEYLKYSLQKVLEEKIPLKKADKISILTNLAGGLERFENFSEQDSLIHCDIKPANVLVSLSKQKRLERKRVFFADFGVGAICRKGTSIEINGYTKKYSSPEILTDNRASTKSDVYALGILALDILGIDNQNISDWKENYDPILFEDGWNTIIKNFKSDPKERVFNDEMLKLIKSMLSHDPLQRPKASEILKDLHALKKAYK